MAEKLCEVLSGRFSLLHNDKHVTFEMVIPFLMAPTLDRSSGAGMRVLYADVRLLSLLSLSLSLSLSFFRSLSVSGTFSVLSIRFMPGGEVVFVHVCRNVYIFL